MASSERLKYDGYCHLVSFVSIINEGLSGVTLVFSEHMYNGLLDFDNR